MYKELNKCISELQENHTDREIAGALSEYFQIVKSVSYDYTDNVTIAELRADHPELDFMDDDEIEEILGQAKTMRQKRGAAKEERHLTADDVYGFCHMNGLHMPLGLFEKVQVAAEDGASIHDLAVMIWSHNDNPLEEIEQAMVSYWESEYRRSAGIGARREEVFQKIMEETRIRNRIEEDALKLIAENRHAEAAKLLADLDDDIIKGLYQEYWDLRK